VVDLRALVPDAEFVFFLTSPGGEKVVAEYATRGGMLDPGYDTIPLGERVSGWVAANRQQIINSDARLDLGPTAAGTSLLYCVATPLVCDGRTTGVLTAYADNALSAESARRLSEVAPQVAQVLAAVAHTVPLRQAKVRLSRPDLRVAVSR